MRLFIFLQGVFFVALALKLKFPQHESLFGHVIDVVLSIMLLSLLINIIRSKDEKAESVTGGNDGKRN